MKRLDLVMDAGTTFRAGFRIGENYGADDERTYDDTDVTSVRFKVRSSDHGMTDDIPLRFDGGRWWLELTDDKTEDYPLHRAVYWALDATYASGDVVRMVQGPIRVRSIGGR
jgi:hypothetical protein